MTDLPWLTPDHTPRPVSTPPSRTEPVCTGCYQDITGHNCLNTPWKYPAPETVCHSCGNTTVSGLRLNANEIQGKQ